MLVEVNLYHEGAGGSGLSDHGGDGDGHKDAAGHAGRGEREFPFPSIPKNESL